MDSFTRSRDSIENVGDMTMSYELLQLITDNFSEERLVGRGTFGMVYKGTYGNGNEIAVKVLRDMAALDDKDFKNELQNLAKLDHKNIVQLVGYCKESETHVVEHDGRQVTAQKLHMALCFEYVDNGNLNKYISDENQGLPWHIRYKIIKGICEGLKHLHKGLKTPVLHLDLKPHNILLDKEMVPKIADFGLSRIIGEERTRQTMNKNTGTRGYLPPEYTKFQLLSPAFDIFSLGIIITKIMVGKERYHDIADMRPRKLVNLVHTKWKNRLRAILKQPRSLELYCHQVKECIKIASRCLMEDWHRRPQIEEIIDTLNGTERINIPWAIEEFEESRTSVTIVGSSEGDREASSPRMMEEYSYTFLRKITNNFSKERLIDEGGFGNVYKGVHEDGQVTAVEVLHNVVDALDDNKYMNEIRSMMNLWHENIIQLLGYCNETENTSVEYNGRIVIAETIRRALCWQHMQNGSLQYHISDASHGLDWFTRYKIIKGICDGLRYLHENMALHLDLNPNNILLDENMVPKIRDFGMSRFFGDEPTVQTMSPIGTFGYLPPEYINKQVISTKFDIFSLGAIVIKMMSGMSAYSLLDDMTSQDFMELVVGKWRTRLQATLMGRSLEGYCQQVKKCIEIALRCLEYDRNKRPNIGEVVRMLDEIETSIQATTDTFGSLDLVSSIGHIVSRIRGKVSVQFPLDGDLEDLKAWLSSFHSEAMPVLNNARQGAVVMDLQKILGAVTGLSELLDEFTRTVPRDTNGPLKKDQGLAVHMGLERFRKATRTISDQINALRTLNTRPAAQERFIEESQSDNSLSTENHAVRIAVDKVPMIADSRRDNSLTNQTVRPAIDQDGVYLSFL